jgi:hypothetical protein
VPSEPAPQRPLGPVTHRSALHAAWAAYGDERRITALTEVSAFVSTNEVYRIALDDGAHVIAKVSSYGSYFLFAEDHDRLYRLSDVLANTRFSHLLARVLGRDGRAFTWYDGKLWVVFYEEIDRARSLPPILDDAAVENLAREMATLHLACADAAKQLPPMSNSVKVDAIHLLEQLESPIAPFVFGLSATEVSRVWGHTHRFLLHLEQVRYDEWLRIPLLVDWNLGNFSVADQPDGSFQLYSRWDYDWFRLEPRVHDFYFLSRVSSETGDLASWTYSSHTLLEPRFLRFLAAYHEVYPLTEQEVRFLPEAYRFFILNYVVREGKRFFRPDLCARFRTEAATGYLPDLDRFDPSPLLRAVGM